MGWFEERARLEGTVAVVTGGAGGLGEAITLDLAANGVRVAVVDRDAEATERLRDRFAADGTDGIVHDGDVREPEVLDALFTALDERWGRLDTLVNVPGGTFRAAFTDTSPKGWDTLLRTNFMHVLHACSRAVPLIRRGGRGGSIVNLTTIECHRGAPGYAVYSAAKAAVTEFARSLAVELAPEGIRVNNVAPDFTPTPNMVAMGQGRLTSTDSALGLSIAFPMGRPGQVTDVSNAVVFLASGLSSYVTGQTIHPDGGTWASGGFFNWPGSGFGNTLPLDVLDAIQSTLDR